MKSLTSLLVFTCLFLCAFAVRSSYADCPECYQDNMRVPDNGARSANGRPIITLKLTSDWNVSSGQSDPRIYNAVSGAVAGWNDATNGSGNGSYYEIAFNQQTQTTDDRQVNIRIVKDPNIEAVGQVFGPPGGPYSIHLRSDVADTCSAEALLTIIEHEIGHVYGLYHPKVSTNVPCFSMMRPADSAQCSSVNTNLAITQADVDLTTRLATDQLTRNGCKHAWPPNGGAGSGPTATPTPFPTATPPGCIDQDHDGVCALDDCDDSDPTVAYDSDGDHYCYPDDCDDYNANVYPGAPLNPNTEGGEDRDCNGVDDYEQQYGGGGGGGGGYYCTPYFWVYYESYDGGRTWSVVDIQYAGCW
jgi:hypothetical protein